MRRIAGWLTASVGALAICLLCSTGRSGATVYTLDDFSNADGSVSGTITTDGTLGFISNSHITDFSLTVTISGRSDTITSSNGSIVPVSGGGFVTTSTQLEFNNTNPGSTVAFENSGGFVDFTGNYSELWIQLNAQPSVSDTFAFSPIVLQIGAVPEPSTWAMMILGFVGLGFLAKRKSGLRFA